MPVAAPARGFYTTPINVALTSTTPGAVIRYTTDGSVPTASTGTVYTAPFAVAHTTNVRSAAFAPGVSPSNTLTTSYIFLADTIAQPNGIPGFPNGVARSVGDVTALEDTEMDPEIVNSPTYGPQMTAALTAIPTMNITSPLSSIFGEANGFYDWDETGIEPENAASIELLHPTDPTKNQQIDAGVEPHSHDRIKRSLRVNMRAQFGPTTWVTNAFREGPLNGASATNQVKTFVLRAGEQSGVEPYLESGRHHLHRR